MPVKTQELSITNLSVIYDRIYDIADKLFKKHNPCKIHIECKKLHCVEYHGDRSYDTSRLCCSGCGEYPRYKTHWSKTGCNTKCLACKLYCCSTAYRQMSRRFIDQLYRLRKFAAKHGLPASSYYFVSKEEWLEQTGE